MTEDEKKLKVATFRFGIISEFVNGLRFSYGEREKFIKDKISRSYEIPFSVQKLFLERHLRSGYMIINMQVIELRVSIHEHEMTKAKAVL